MTNEQTLYCFIHGEAVRILEAWKSVLIFCKKKIISNLSALNSPAESLSYL